MVNTIFIIKHKQYIGFHTTGHAGNADNALPGQELVCAAVSVLTQNTANSLEHFLGEKNLSVYVDEGELKVYLASGLDKTKMHDAQVLLQALYLGLTNLEDTYPKYLKVGTQEVD